MTDPVRQQMEFELELLEKERKKLEEFQGKMSAVAGKGRSANRMVNATVDQRGRLTELVFEGSRYRTLPAKELASHVMEAVGAAQDDAQSQAMAFTSTMLPPGLADVFGLGKDSAGPAGIGEVFDAAYRLTDMSTSGGKPAKDKTNQKDFR